MVPDISITQLCEIKTTEKLSGGVEERGTKQNKNLAIFVQTIITQVCTDGRVYTSPDIRYTSFFCFNQKEYLSSSNLMCWLTFTGAR